MLVKKFPLAGCVGLKMIFSMLIFLNFSSFFNCQNKNWLVKNSLVAGCVGFTDDPDHPGSGRPPVSP